MKRILFISTHNFATNPRLVKEVDLALQHNYEVSVLCCAFNNWSKGNNEKIKQRLAKHVRYYEIAGNRNPFLPWLMSTIMFELAKWVLRVYPNSVYWLSIRSNKRSWLLIKGLKKLRESPDIVVAHNIGSFYPALHFAKNKGSKIGTDMEDYHPGETNNPRVSNQIKVLLQNVLPKADYITAASPLILEETKKASERFSSDVKIVLNYFSEDEFVAPAEKGADKVKLVWFSQNIAQGRGLEEIIPVIRKIENVELHLYGNTDPEFYKSHIEGIQNIHVHQPLPQEDLHKALSRYDAGLAIEKPSSNFNRDICLTNKLLAYFQAGLYIVASETAAQKEFLREFPKHGILTSLHAGEPEKAFQHLWNHKACLRSSATERFEEAKNYNWENESQKLLALWKNL